MLEMHDVEVSLTHNLLRQTFFFFFNVCFKKSLLILKDSNCYKKKCHYENSQVLCIKKVPHLKCVRNFDYVFTV